MAEKPDYGIDAPGVIRNLLLIGGGLLLASVFLDTVHLGSVKLELRRMLIFWGVVLLLEGAAMLLYSKVGKFAHRDRLLAKVNWRGDEHVLDVGTGRGVLLIGAAKRLTSGRAVGIDIWNKEDLSGNNEAATLRNAEIENVRDRVQLLNEDARKMSFPDASFDVVVSNLCLHNIPEASGRAQACKEIARVLKPGGIAVISDFKKTAEYESAFRAAGLTAERSAPHFFSTFPPLREVIARKGA